MHRRGALLSTRGVTPAPGHLDLLLQAAGWSLGSHQHPDLMCKSAARKRQTACQRLTRLACFKVPPPSPRVGHGDPAAHPGPLGWAAGAREHEGDNGAGVSPTGTAGWHWGGLGVARGAPAEGRGPVGSEIPAVAGGAGRVGAVGATISVISHRHLSQQRSGSGGTAQVPHSGRVLGLTEDILRATMGRGLLRPGWPGGGHWGNQEECRLVSTEVG